MNVFVVFETKISCGKQYSHVSFQHKLRKSHVNTRMTSLWPNRKGFKARLVCERSVWDVWLSD